MPGGRSGLFPSLEKQREELARKRSEERAKPCPMRHPINGNCLPHGGFCLNAVSDSACEAMHKAYEMGVTAGATRARREEEKPLTLEELRQMDGKPVYIVPLKWYGKKEWAIVERNLCRCLSPVNNYYFEEYGSLWLAYRRPPVKEEATP